MSIKFKREGFVYKVATTFQDKGREKDYHNGCELFRDFVLSGLGLVAALMVIVLVYVFMFVIGFFVGERPPFSRKEFELMPKSKTLLLIEYKHWPVVAGRRVYPIVVLFGLFVFWILGLAGTSLYEDRAIIADLLSDSSALTVIAGSCGIGLISYGVLEFRKSETWALTKANITGFFSGLCPSVEIVDE